jgi:hypothetical protein
VLLSGYLHPSTTGNHVFYLASDDQGALWLSTDENPLNKVLIAYEPEWNPVRAYNTMERYIADESPVNVSPQIYLEYGKKYFIEAAMKEGTGGDNLAVAWRMPGAGDVQDGDSPIPGEYLSPLEFDPANLPPLSAYFILHPESRLGILGHSVTFSCFVAGSAPIQLQWRRNDIDIPGANGLTYTTPPLTSNDDGATYTVWAENSGGTASSEAALRVIEPVPGRHYEIILSPGITWDQAKTAAEELLWNGRPGHLATITSEQEDLHIEALRQEAMETIDFDVGLRQFWVGGYQLADQSSVADGWFWVNDEGPIPMSGDLGYSNWILWNEYESEPNDCCGTTGVEDNEENHLAIGLNGLFGWNDSQGGLMGFVVEFDGIAASIDILPGSEVNPVNLKSKGLLPVALLTEKQSGFDARDVDLSSPALGDPTLTWKVAALRSAWEDVDKDGHLDLVLLFSIPALLEAGAINSSSQQLELHALTLDNVFVSGADVIRIVP